MMKISNWVAVASAAIGVMAMGCTVTSGDDGDAGTGGSTPGTGGSAGAGLDSGGGSGTVTVEAGTDAIAAKGVCETCLDGNCAAFMAACRADTVNGCAEALPVFITCLGQTNSADPAAACGSDFITEAQHPSSDAGNGIVGADKASDLATCAMDATSCLAMCKTADGG